MTLLKRLDNEPIGLDTIYWTKSANHYGQPMYTGDGFDILKTKKNGYQVFDWNSNELIGYFDRLTEAKESAEIKKQTKIY